MFQRKDVEKIKTHIFMISNYSRETCYLWDNVEKYGTAGPATDNNIIQDRKKFRLERRANKPRIQTLTHN